MGNCNTQQLARQLEDKCGSGGAPSQRANRRRRISSEDEEREETRVEAATPKLPLQVDEQAQQTCPKGSERQPACPSNIVDASDTTKSKATVAEPATVEDNRPSGNESEPSSRTAESAREKLERLKEGLDFIETEEDVKAVEAATLKIQSTFRGKKFRSKLGPASKKADEEQPASSTTTSTKTKAGKQVNKIADQQQQQQSEQQKQSSADELSQRVDAMQVQDNNNEEQPQVQVAGNPPEEEEAERAATKIQAGFKGYKTRKELEVGGKLSAAGASSSAQQGAPPAGHK